jgi:hypothetical protein
VIGINEEILNDALFSKIEDFEDAVIEILSKEIAAEYILTRNINDFKKSVIKPVAPEELLIIIKTDAAKKKKSYNVNTDKTVKIWIKNAAPQDYLRFFVPPHGFAPFGLAPPLDAAQRLRYGRKPVLALSREIREDFFSSPSASTRGERRSSKGRRLGPAVPVV